MAQQKMIYSLVLDIYRYSCYSIMTLGAARISLKVFQHLVSVHLLAELVSLEAVVDEALDLAAVVYELLEVELVCLVARDLSQRQEPGHQLRHDQHHHHRASRDLWGKSECFKQLWLFKPSC